MQVIIDVWGLDYDGFWVVLANRHDAGMTCHRKAVRQGDASLYRQAREAKAVYRGEIRAVTPL